MTPAWTEERVETTVAGAMPVRVYGASSAGRSAPVVLQLHGGAFTGGSLESGAEVAEMLAAAGAVVVSADYPVGSDHPFPDPLKAVYEAMVWTHEARARLSGKTAKLYVAGAEAGGNLAAALAMMARDQQFPALFGQILISPMLDANLATCSLRMADAGPVGCKWADGWHAYLGSADKAGHPYAAPLSATRLAGLAPALIITADDDPLRDEALSYGRRLGEAGVSVRTHVVPAPTGWPCTIDGDSQCDCVTALVPVIRAFLDETRAGPAKRPARSQTRPQAKSPNP
ncbi:alpha/beta hydrolase fold domain-containing protein [Aquabacter cavernae]|uniref:alpha/beta hydrolase fold domain-containing protein n=1 Tax=Aquabacter cavernae TaxID=2496029 RepID=UPI00196A2E58|nr:alpha/beta hydrolase [Aquabacter cavernae]